jgi:hypothetical protein
MTLRCLHRSAEKAALGLYLAHSDVAQPVAVGIVAGKLSGRDGLGAIGALVDVVAAES